jgi:Na+-transporting methylmalonyl-CoA/oxaloacetate decarboxylase gamma subunit
MKLTKRGEAVSVIAFLTFMIAVMGIVGAIETQDFPGCEDYQAEQNWEAAWKNGCPFQDEQGNYLYTWEVNN